MRVYRMYEAMAPAAMTMMGESAMVALRAYYVDLEDLDLIAMELQVSLRTIYRIRNRAFEYIDCAGLVKDDEKIVC